MRRDATGYQSPVLVHMTTVPESLGFLTGQVRFIRESGFRVVALSSPGAALRAFGQSEGIETMAISMERRISPFRDLNSLSKLVKYFLKLRPQIVHAHTPKAGLLGMMAGFLARVPIRIYHLHGLPYETSVGFKRLLLRLTEWFACFCATDVFAVSPSILKVANDAGLCERSIGKVIHNGTINGVDSTNRFNPGNPKLGRTRTRQLLGISQDELVVGFVGRLVRDKGIVELAEAWDVIRKSRDDSHLVLVGYFEDQDPVPDEIKQVLVTDPRVHLVGWTDSPETYYSVMDVFALPSYREGFGLAAAEASSMQVPVVASEISGLVDAVEHGVTGMLVPVRDSMALSESILAYLDDSSLRTEHGIAGRVRVQRLYEPQKVWEAVLAEYQNRIIGI